MPERFWVPIGLTLPTVAPGQNSGALRFVSPVLHIPSRKDDGHRRNVSARKVSGYSPETTFQKLSLKPAHTKSAKLKAHNKPG